MQRKGSRGAEISDIRGWDLGIRIGMGANEVSPIAIINGGMRLPSPARGTRSLIR